MASVKLLGFDSYDDYLKSEHWLTLRAHRLERDGTCKACGTSKRLVLHHTSYERLGYEAKTDLVVMCAGCHQKLHDYLDAAYPRSDLQSKVRRTRKVWIALFGKALTGQKPADKQVKPEPKKTPTWLDQDVRRQQVLHPPRILKGMGKRAKKRLAALHGQPAGSPPPTPMIRATATRRRLRKRQMIAAKVASDNAMIARTILEIQASNRA